MRSGGDGHRALRELCLITKNYGETMQLLTEEKSAIKVFVEVKNVLR
jgi:hypothetical protein